MKTVVINRKLRYTVLRTVWNEGGIVVPLYFCRNDIVKMADICDAIVVPANTLLIPGGGVDWAIHSAAGPGLKDYCQSLGGCPVGAAVASPAFQLPCRHIIHTVPPYWDDETSLGVLRLCYVNCLDLVKKLDCKKVAFPLLGAGTCGFPKHHALSAALSVIGEFLLTYGDIEVHVVLFDKDSLEVAQRLFSVQEYIDEVYALAHGSFDEKRRAFREARGENATEEEWEEFRLNLMERYQEAARSIDEELRKAIRSTVADKQKRPRRSVHPVTAHSVEGYIEENFQRDIFLQTLYGFLDAKGVSEVECYKRADVRKQTWHKIVSSGRNHYRPTKHTVVAIAIALKLTLDETKTLLMTTGYALSEGLIFDVILAACIKAGVYDPDYINSLLLAHDEKMLFFRTKE